jgi:hypothetical protein
VGPENICDLSPLCVRKKSVIYPHCVSGKICDLSPLCVRKEICDLSPLCVRKDSLIYPHCVSGKVSVIWCLCCQLNLYIFVQFDDGLFVKPKHVVAGSKYMLCTVRFICFLMCNFCAGYNRN